MASYRYQALGPLLAGEGSRAFLGLAISEDSRARPVVIIWVPDTALTDPALLAKIQRETEHAAKLDHPNIVTVMGFAKLDEGSARVVEFADGESLRKIIETGKKLPPRIAAKIMCDACTGTHYAHIAGNDDGTPLVHGDLRPETILISFNGVTKVTGYGALAFAPRELGGQRVKGRRVHSAPEQVIGGRDAITIPTDVYLLGLTLYECLTGAVPWADQGDFFDHAVLTLPLPPAPPGDVPEALEAVIQKACAKKANDRYPTPLAMREAIEAAVGTELASTEELTKYLDTLFPQSHQLRADRRHTIDAGIADFVRRQWADKERTETTPMMRAVVPPPGPPQPASSTPAPASSVAARPPAPAQRARASQEEDEGDAKEEGSSTPWLILLAVFIAVIAGWWAMRKANEPIPGAGPPPSLTPTRPAAAIDAGVPVVEVDAGAPASEPDAGQVPDTDAGAAAVPEPLADAGVAALDAGHQAPAEVEVRIESRPSAELFLDGQSLGRTPWTGRLSPGRKTFRFENKPALLNAFRAVTLKAEPVSESFTFEKGKVIVKAPEGAAIFIDGTRVGTAPIRGEIPVYEGSHRISVSYGKAKWSEPFTLYAGQPVTFNVEMQ
ncbi:MAG: protein kinase [Myxococcales bacterium]|nr:protein kinase [Myxococcales bacterium]